MVNSMEDRYDISVDIGEGKDYSVATLFEIYDNGEYRPIATMDVICNTCDIQRSGYVGLDLSCEGKFSFSSPFSLIRLQQYTKQLLAYRVDIGKRRKTTYKTIRRDCAKRNRGK